MQAAEVVVNNKQGQTRARSPSASPDRRHEKRVRKRRGIRRDESILKPSVISDVLSHIDYICCKGTRNGPQHVLCATGSSFVEVPALGYALFG